MEEVTSKVGIKVVEKIYMNANCLLMSIFYFFKAAHFTPHFEFLSFVTENTLLQKIFSNFFFFVKILF